MKTNKITKSLFLNVRVPEIIIWIIGLLCFALILGSLNGYGQTPPSYAYDTIWFKSGEAIPCQVLEDSDYAETVKVKVTNAEGQVLYIEYGFDDILRISKSTDQSKLKWESAFPKVPNRPKIYIGMGYGISNSINLSVNFLLKNYMGGSMGYRYYYMNDKDQLNIWSLCFVKSFQNKRSRRVRLGIEGGPAYVIYSDGRKHTYTHGFWGTFETVSYTTYRTFGLSLKAKLELPVTQVLGFEIALSGNINPHRPVMSVDFCLTLGRVRDRIKPKK
jgi:hypothetical protein